MDLSGLEMPMSATSTLGTLQPNGLHTSISHQLSPLEREGISRDYAELYRVSAATASPLRRRASEKLAAQAGFSLPQQNQQSISPTG